MMFQMISYISMLERIIRIISNVKKYIDSSKLTVKLKFRSKQRGRRCGLGRGKSGKQWRLYSMEGTGGGAGLVELIESMTLIVYGEQIRSTNCD
jgi:hypothetical protein